MSKKIFAGLAIAVTMGATTAEARVDHGLVPSLYEANENWRGKPGLGKNFKSPSKKYVRTAARRYKGGRKAKRSYRKASASRSCLKPSARALLNRIEAKFGPVQVISTCRPGAVIRTSGKPSKHRYGLAVDFNAGSRKKAIVNWLVANHRAGGTMTYAGMSHIHVDIGYRFVKLHARGHG